MVFRDKRHFQIAIEINVYFFFLALRLWANYNKTKTMTEAVHMVKLKRAGAHLHPGLLSFLPDHD